MRCSGSFAARWDPRLRDGWRYATFPNPQTYAEGTLKQRRLLPDLQGCQRLFAVRAFEQGAGDVSFR